MGRLASEIVSRRLAAQWISATDDHDPAAVVSWLCAMQAQDYLAALWAVGLRARGAREADVEQAIADRRIVRTWPMRGTLHFVAAEDARWMTELLAPSRVSRAKGRLSGLGIDGTVLARARKVLAKNLEGGRTLTRPAAFQVLERGKVSTTGQRGIHIFWCLAQECFLCFGPREGKQPTVVLFEEWLPGARGLAREDALGELAFRYFRGHGPATLRDLARWGGLTLGDARLAVTLAASRIQSEKLGEETYWFVDGPKSAPATDRDGGTYAMPAFDELLVGYEDRSSTVDPAAEKRVITGGLFKPFVMHGGRVLGTWSRRIERKEVVCEMRPFGELPRASVAAATRAFERYAAFVGMGLRVRAA